MVSPHLSTVFLSPGLWLWPSHSQSTFSSLHLPSLSQLCSKAAAGLLTAHLWARLLRSCSTGRLILPCFLGDIWVICNTGVYTTHPASTLLPFCETIDSSSWQLKGGFDVGMCCGFWGRELFGGGFTAV